MASIVSVVAQKGGVAKSTMCQCLAVEALREGRPAAIVDADPQGSVAQWGQARLGQEITAPTVVALGSKSLKAVVADLQARGATLILIDTPPTVSPVLNTALQVSTAALLPTRPNPMDVAAVEATWAITQKLKLPSVAIITQAPPGSQRAKALTLTRNRLGAVGISYCPTSITYSLSYPYAQAAALTVQEREPSSKARAELAEVWGWLKRSKLV